MTIAVKVLLTVALIFSIAVPFGAFAAGEKTRGRYKTALAANTVMFFGTMLFAVCVLFNGTAFAAESTAAAGGISTGMGYIAAALSTGLSCIERRRRAVFRCAGLQKQDNARKHDQYCHSFKPFHKYHTFIFYIVFIGNDLTETQV